MHFSKSFELEEKTFILGGPPGRIGCGQYFFWFKTKNL